jgi:very-short-patch-repair endonuclease
LNNKSKLKTIRKKLRNNLTPAEAKLWTNIQNRKLNGIKFRRQHGIDNYVLDFYCPEKKFGIELDGNVHSNSVIGEKDLLRINHLESYGIKILRFENKDIFENLEYVLEVILNATTSSFDEASKSTPPWKGGE